MNTLKNSLLQFSLIEWALLVNAVTVIHLKWVPIGILVLGLAFIVEAFQKKLRFQVSKVAYLLLSIPFLLACIGLLNTENYSKAFEDLGRLLPFVLFPFLLAFIRFHAKFKECVLLVFSVGLGMFFLVSLIKAFILYLDDGLLNHLFYASLVEDTNSYSMFNMFAITALLEVVFRRNTPLLKQLPVLSLLVFLLVIQLQLQSRIVIVTTFMSMFFLFIFHWKSSKKWLVLGLLVFSGLLMQVPAFQGRFQTVVAQTKHIPTKTEHKASQNLDSLILFSGCNTSTSLRYNALLTSYEIIRKHPLVGVGTGDWRDELVKGYTENKRICNVKEETAPHNQYVRTILKHGVLGFLVLAVYFIFLGKTAIQKRELAQLSYLFCLIFCALGYDLMDGGGTAPFVAFFASLLFLARSEETHITSLSSHSV